MSVGLARGSTPARLPRWLRVGGAAVALHAVAAGALVYVLGHTGLWYGLHDGSDVGLYFHYAGEISRGQRPFLDFTLEYPPLAVPWFVWPGHAGDLDAYRLAFQAEMLLACAGAALLTGVAAASLWRGGRARAAAAVFAIGVAANGAIVANRYDATVALVVAGVLALLAHRRTAAAALLVGAGFALKLAPAVLLPLVLLLAGGGGPLARSTAAFAVAALAPFMPLLAAGGGGLAHLVRYHVDRPLQVESLLATPLLLGHLAGWTRVEIRDAYGGQVIAGSELLAAAAGLLGLLALGAAYATIWRRRALLRTTPRLVPLAALAVLLAVIAPAKVLSPQFLVWLLPAAALVAPERRALGAAVLGAMLLTQLEFPGRYSELTALQPGAVLLVAARNGLLAVASVASLVALARLPRREDVARRAAGGTAGLVVRREADAAVV